MFRFHEKKLKQAQEQGQEKGKVLILALVLASLLVPASSGRFHGEIRLNSCFYAVSALVLASVASENET